jgi:tRNA nucleotidyltransferase/poly(A) polymerase
MSKVESLLKFLVGFAKEIGAAEHSYVVGGAVRNHLMGLDPKDFDLVVDSIGLGPHKDSAWFAKKLLTRIPARASLVTNQYGVAIVTVADSWVLDGHDLKGEVLEIANARRESYGAPEGKGYKPHMVEPATIEEDLLRREFTCNTLLWRLADLGNGPAEAPVLDLLGVGVQHLTNRELVTPVDPDKTFSDDPTRMIRAIKFEAKYGLKPHADTAAAIRRNAHKLAQMPWDAVRKILVEDILEAPNPRHSVVLLKDFGLAPVIQDMLAAEPGFATGVGRALPGLNIHVVLDLIELGWGLKTPVSFLSAAERGRLREVLWSNPTSFEVPFVGALKQPAINQERIFELHGLKGAARGRVIQHARALLLEDPSLLSEPERLERLVEERVSAG